MTTYLLSTTPLTTDLSRATSVYAWSYTSTTRHETPKPWRCISPLHSLNLTPGLTIKGTNMVANERLFSCSSSITMLHLFYFALPLLLSLQLVIADSTSFLRHSKASSLEKQSLLSALLVPQGKFNPRAGDACPTGYREGEILGNTHQVLTLL